MEGDKKVRLPGLVCGPPINKLGVVAAAGILVSRSNQAGRVISIDNVRHSQKGDRHADTVNAGIVIIF